MRVTCRFRRWWDGFQRHPRFSEKDAIEAWNNYSESYWMEYDMEDGKVEE